ncbi:calcium-binding protein [Microseira wollei]|uniref:Peptidyl-prolyl cis-trans isomerase n=1 Tax=Microseira wollei NIES-4236 TaxID=2530354 RepID=A0AAV3XBR5_9CYAN|nr:calcium-binding protein [Microseira wollei]GET38821.1 peptidyl-prolyl cis-trans isomerase [Microseira wollei NIES-4236]
MTGPSPDGYYGLTPGNDSFQITPGLLTRLPIGLLGLTGNDRITGSSDAEIINGNQGDDFIFGRGGDDIIYGGKDQDQLWGDEGNDTLNGNLGDDSIYGGAGNDLIRGGKGTDILRGDAGDDTLIGDFGADVLTGGSGSDLFVLRPDTVLAEPTSADLILDFDKSSDRIGISNGLTAANLVLRQENIPINQALNDPRLVNNPEIQNLINNGLVAPRTLSPELIRQVFQSFTGIDIDPNRDGIIVGTSIELQNGTGLGFALNVVPADLQNLMVPVSNI